MSKVGAKTLNERQVLRLGRTLRRMSRTTRDLMRDIGITDEEVKITRKKRPPSNKEKETA